MRILDLLLGRSGNLLGTLRSPELLGRNPWMQKSPRNFLKLPREERPN